MGKPQVRISIGLAVDNLEIIQNGQGVDDVYPVDTNSTPSGTYSGVFTVVNNGSPLDPDNLVNISAFRLHDPPSLSGDEAITKGPGESVNLTGFSPVGTTAPATGR